MSRVATGLDRVAGGDDLALRAVRGRRIGLLAHPASVDARLVHALDVLRDVGADVRALFGPEHGWAGHAQDMIGVEGGAEARLPIYSLYGQTEADLSPRPEQLDGLDALVIDLQDVGSRYYTYVWTAALAFRAAAAVGVETVILDRPNPLGGDVVEGAPQREGYRSFVGLYDVAVRHGMTIGEIATMVCSLEGIDPKALALIPMRGFSRSMRWEDTGLPWVLPSPNMPTPDTARVYPGGCLLEGTNLSEGRGLTRPFEIFGAPFVDGDDLAKAIDVDGAVLRPLRFTPTFHKHAGQLCGGVQVHVTDPLRFRPWEAYLRMLAHLRGAAPERFAWRTEPYEFVSDRPAIDLLTGGPELRTAADAGADLGALLDRDRAGAEAFAQRRAAWLRYP